MLDLFSCLVDKTHTDKGRNRKIGWDVITTVPAEVTDDGLDEVKMSRAASNLI